MTLEQFLETVAADPFSDGERDCILTVADWVKTKGHPDPAEPFRGTYSTAFGRERLLIRLGGIKQAMIGGAKRSGLAPVRRPRREDVGLVLHRGEQLAAICLGKLWAAKGQGVVAFKPKRIIKAWKT